MPGFGVGLALSLTLAVASPRVVLVGMDGMTFEVLDPLLQKGELPVLAQLVAKGARAVLKSEEPMRSPALWTTIATGQPRAVHGIYDFITGSGYWPRALRHKDKRLVTSNMRQSPALWNYASEAGLASVTVGWLNTWPAEAVHGVMVAPYVALSSRRQTTIKGRIYDDVKKQSHPPGKFAELRHLVVDTAEVPDELVARLIDEPSAKAPILRQIPILSRYLYAVRWTLASALTNTAVLEKLLAEQQDAALVMTYFDGADTLGHRFWSMRESRERLTARLVAEKLPVAAADELAARFGGAVDGYYRVFDELLGRIIAAAGPEATVIVISDHGFGPAPSLGAPHKSVPFDGTHLIDGVLLAAGPAIKPGRYEPLTQYEIAPTVMALAGVVVPKELPGRVARELLVPELLPKPRGAASAAASKPARAAPKPAATPFADEEMERLRSLGYVD